MTPGDSARGAATLVGLVSLGRGACAGTRRRVRARRRAAFLIAATTCLALSTRLAGQAPEPFEPFQGRYAWDNGAAFSPDGAEMFFALLYEDYLEVIGRSDSGVPHVALFSARRTDAGWSEPELLPFSGTYPDYEPTLSGDGSLLVFNSRRPYEDGRTPEANDLWMVRRMPHGWSLPTRIQAISTFDNEESYGTLAADGTLIFLRRSPGPAGDPAHDLYESRFEEGAFRPSARHPVSTDRWGEADPWVAPDQTYLIFTRWDESVGWAETVDLYIAFRTQAGWSTPRAIDEVNTEGADYGPAVSPDGVWFYYRTDGEARRFPLETILRRHR